jgi:hypothetical protein
MYHVLTAEYDQSNEAVQRLEFERCQPHPTLFNLHLRQWLCVSGIVVFCNQVVDDESDTEISMQMLAAWNRQ